MSIISPNARLNLFSFICGAIFTISGVMKALDSGAFARLLGEYGIPYFEYFAPVIIIVEILIGVMLMLRVWERPVALVSTFMVTIFTCGFTYGLFFHNIEDCGCFGQAEILNTSPVLLYVRNCLLLIMLIDITLHSPQNKLHSIFTPISSTLFATILVGGCIMSFITGNTFRHIHSPYKVDNTPAKAVAIKDSPLRDLITTHPDSSYLVFAFTYKCPHCLNSIANLNNYETSRVVDRVIAIAKGDAQAETHFREQFNPTFRIINNAKGLKSLTKDFPKSFYIVRDSIIVDFAGELPCPQVFSAAIQAK